MTLDVSEGAGCDGVLLTWYRRTYSCHPHVVRADCAYAEYILAAPELNSVPCKVGGKDGKWRRATTVRAGLPDLSQLVEIVRREVSGSVGCLIVRHLLLLLHLSCLLVIAAVHER